MNAAFYVAAVIAVIATLLALTRANAVHGLLYLIVSLLAVAVVFYVLGATFVAALEVIIYAGAIVVLFVFVVMMLNLGRDSVAAERAWMRPRIWIGPSILAAVLIVEVAYFLWSGVPGVNPAAAHAGSLATGPVEVGMALFGPYVLGVELASMLLLAGIVGAYHVGRRTQQMRDQPGGAHGLGAA
ncbi:MAG TPA: NADH-quinone oxidoreductase subunit J [Vicinamibacterales bacterium]|jgi:NADH-quinone oxidoreductase subunit J